MVEANKAAGEADVNSEEKNAGGEVVNEEQDADEIQDGVEALDVRVDTPEQPSAVSRISSQVSASKHSSVVLSLKR